MAHFDVAVTEPIAVGPPPGPASAPAPGAPSAPADAAPPKSADDGDGGAFWGSARDIGLLAVAVLGFAGTVYTYTYVHVLGIDFSLTNTSPVASLVAASKIFVDNALGMFALVVVAAGVFAAVRLARRGGGRDGLAQFARHRTLQVAATLLGALAVCILGYVTATRDVAALRKGSGINPAIVTFEPGAEAKYPAALQHANDGHGLYVVLDTTDRLYVMVQPAPIAAAANELPDARVFSIRKDDIVSVETNVPPARIR